MIFEKAVPADTPSKDLSVKGEACAGRDGLTKGFNTGFSNFGETGKGIGLPSRQALTCLVTTYINGQLSSQILNPGRKSHIPLLQDRPKTPSRLDRRHHLPAPLNPPPPLLPSLDLVLLQGRLHQ